MRVADLDDIEPPQADDATLSCVRMQGRRLRRRRRTGRGAAIAVALVVAATVTIAFGHGSGLTKVGTQTPTTGGASPASWPIYRDVVHDFSVPVAPGWYRSAKPLEPWLVSPGEILSMATTHLSPAGHAAACAGGIPQTAVDNIGPDGVYLWLGEWHPSAAPYGSTPNPRPEHFDAVAWTALCPLTNGIVAKEYTFTDGSRDLTAHLVIGPGASSTRTTEVYQMLDGLRFGT